METLIDKLRKIEALARSGIAGERENAQRLLDALCAKHGVTIDQIVAPEITRHSFTYSSRYEAKLLRQCAIFVCQTHKVPNSHSGKSLHFWLTVAQAIDLRDCFDHYRKAMAEHLDDAMAAFVHTNHIYGPSSESSDEELTEKERAKCQRIAAMVAFMAPNRWEKRLLLAG